MYELKHIGQMCAKARREKGYTQLQVAFAVDYTPENVSAFENGRNDNMRIFLWYLEHCISEFNYMDFMKGLKYYHEN